MNKIAQSVALLRERHYALAASLPNRFFNLWPRRVTHYANRRSDFRIVLYRDERTSDEDDFYSIPYASVQHLLTTENLDKTNSRRWTGEIRNGKLSISNSGVKIDVSAFRNDYTDLGIGDGPESEQPAVSETGAYSSHSDASDGSTTAALPKLHEIDGRLGTVQVLDRIERILQQSGEFNSLSLEDAREFALRSIIYRRGQGNFRRDLLLAYDNACVITGCRVSEVLEAAHIIPYKGPNTNNVQNGLILRSDIHLLFDLFLLAIQPDTHRVRVSSTLQKTEYGGLDGVKASTPASPSFSPSIEALQWRFEQLR